MNKFYLTTPIYYVNARPHIGHAYTTLAADVVTRYQKTKLKQKKIFFLTGTDEHGAKIAESAKKANKQPKEFCNQTVPLFKKTWQNLNINYNHFIRTTDQYHIKGAQKFLSKLKEKNDLYEKQYQGYYCTGCESFLTKHQLDKNGCCPDHQKKPKIIKEKNWFFKLKKYLPQVEKLIKSNKIKIAPQARRLETLSLLKQNLPDFSVSRPNVKWGIPLPWNKKQTIYVWVEALLNYWTAVFKTKNPNSFWPPDLQIIGKDIIKFHAIYWPAILLSYFDGNESKLPKKIFAHGFFTINNQKMSKSLDNVIDPNQLVTEFGQDAARYLILSQFPFGTDGDIKESRFAEKYNADLANGLGNLVARSISLTFKKITNWKKFWIQVKSQSKTINKKYIKAIENIKLQTALKIINQEINQNDQFLSIKKPWKLDKEKDQTKLIRILSKTIASIVNINQQIEPFLPNTAKKISAKIDLKKQTIKNLKPLFPRI